MNFSAIKKVSTFILTASVFFSIVSVSCTKKTKSDDNEVLFDSIHVNKAQSIDYKDTKVNYNLHIAFTYPVECKKESSLSDLQRMFIAKFLPSQYANLSPTMAIDSFSTQYLKDFQAIRWSDSHDEDSMLEDENSFIYELSLENKVLYNKNSLISFVVRNANNGGGGSDVSNSVYGYVINLKTGKLLTEEDFAADNYKKEVSSLLAKKIAAAKGLDDVSQLKDNGYKDIEDIVPNENFTVDDKGITYYFNEDEIAAGFIGITEVFISYDELKAYITNNNPISSLAGF